MACCGNHLITPEGIADSRYPQIEPNFATLGKYQDIGIKQEPLCANPPTQSANCRCTTSSYEYCRRILDSRILSPQSSVFGQPQTCHRRESCDTDTRVGQRRLSGAGMAARGIIRTRSER
jgi:hypothetical protein